jgi:hypothetical protein
LSLELFNMMDIIDNMLNLLKHWQSLSTNDITKFFFNHHSNLNLIKRIQTMVNQIAFQLNIAFVGSSEIVLQHLHDITFYILRLLQHQMVTGSQHSIFHLLDLLLLISFLSLSCHFFWGETHTSNGTKCAVGS